MRKKIAGGGLLLFALLLAFISLVPMNSNTIEPWDKVFHFILYAVFSIIAYAFANSAKQFYLLCFVIVSFSGLMEAAQSFMPGRVMSGYDLLANSMGIVLIIVITRKKILLQKE